jgi:hypothetical protein
VLHLVFLFLVLHFQRLPILLLVLCQTKCLQIQIHTTVFTSLLKNDKYINYANVDKMPEYSWPRFSTFFLLFLSISYHKCVLTCRLCQQSPCFGLVITFQNSRTRNIFLFTVLYFSYHLVSFGRVFIIGCQQNCSFVHSFYGYCFEIIIYYL